VLGNGDLCARIAPDEELQRATLERKSFIPRMVRTVDEEAL